MGGISMNIKIFRHVRPSTILSLGILFWVAVTTAPPSSFAAPPLRPIRCTEARGPFPKFTGPGGVWAAGGTELLLLDNFERVILRYDSTGRSKGAILTSLAKHLQDGKPRSIATSDGHRFYVQVDANRFALVDDRYSFQSVVARKSSADDIVRKVFIYGVTKQEIVAFSDVENIAKNTWNPGFIRFPAEAPESFTWLHKGVSYEEKLWYQLAMPYIVGLGDTAYVLRMTSPYALYRFDPKTDRDLQKLSALDPDRSSKTKNVLPQLPAFGGSADLAPLMEEIEHAEDIPVGLYGYGHRLYVLLRTWRGNHTEWSLKVVDPESDKLLGTVRLAVEADHLSLVPGPSNWAIIKKARPEGIRRQDVTGVTLFDGQALIRGAALPTQVCGQ